MAMAQKRLLTFSTYEMFNVPMFAQSSDHTLLDGTTAGATNWYAHFVMASKAIQFVHVIRSEARTTLYFACSGVQFDIAWGTIEMIAVIDFATETQWIFVDDATDEWAKEIRYIFMISTIKF